jgi:hypothetical protein
LLLATNFKTSPFGLIYIYSAIDQQFTTISRCFAAVTVMQEWEGHGLWEPSRAHMYDIHPSTDTFCHILNKKHTCISHFKKVLYIYKVRHLDNFPCVTAKMKISKDQIIKKW